MNRLFMPLVVLAVLALPWFPSSGLADDRGQKSVLVTGASTGIGRHLAEALAEAGHHVYAGARKQEDLDALNAIENITAVRLDVTKPDEIDAVVALIEERGTGLYALVNNAGIGDGGPVVDTPVEVQTLVYDVNVEGVYRVTRAFAPLVMASNGRIATTGSIAGTLSWPGGSAYSGSKHWIEAFTDALAGEMAPHGVSVSVIQPGNYQTRIRRNSVQRRQARVVAEGGVITPEMREEYERTEARELSYKLPDEVTAAFMHALFDDEPLRRYMVVPSADEQAMTIRTKIEQLVQLNQWGPYSYSADELAAMLRQAMAEGDG
ncbi:SDR family NAD(P)-dependent oxidoreductase [Wenzhouxiangella sp. XN79A]|uniref:SDR family NAD(P)-dependent oxidoreductase n=1 Tax=Wenzhouxiangella sp. XN79A TaxID=2724193 RepID=UPI00144AD78D|nr:SDR family NAD(P)-dependent oxidoreductase [Wenzhouxiangella sp. XN79A]NKI34166.1 SDR family NAD(P)-dependent oxidoreductase [Wenzhouxiangella sp. XN79A]